MAKPRPGGADRPPAPADDAQLWRRVAQSVTRLSKRRASPVFPPPAAAVIAPQAEVPRRTASAVPRPVGPPARPPPELRAGAAPGVDRATHDRLKRGQLPIEAKLDLHGYDREQAHRALNLFVEASADQGRRCLLLVTGKSGVLRAEAPRWLNETPNRTRLIAFTAAQPRHGGAGALYLLLKRRRDS